MIYTIGRYTQSIAMVIIFTTVINLIMPSGDFAKYIKMVLGFIVIITILGPINTLVFKNKPNYTDILNRYQTDIQTTTMQRQSGDYLDIQKDIILENYKERIIPQMTDIIEKNSKIKVNDLDLGFEEDTHLAEFGQIIWIDLIVEIVPKEDKSNIIKVPKIKVGDKNAKSYSPDQIQGEVEEKIKTSIIDFYNLPEANINIIVQKNS